MCPSGLKAFFFRQEVQPKGQRKVIFVSLRGETVGSESGSMQNWEWFLHLQITKVAELKHEGIWFMSLWKDKQTEVQLSSIFWVVFCSERSRYVGAQAPWNSETWHLWNTWLVRGHGESYLRLLAWLTLFTSRLCRNHSSLILILHFTSYHF